MIKEKSLDVCLVVPPVRDAGVPSIATGILKKCLIDSGISCYVDYSNIYFIHHAGFDNISRLVNAYDFTGLGEYIFNETAGITNKYSRDEYVDYICESGKTGEKREKIEQFVEFCCGVATECIDDTVERILEKKPKAVGCSSVFQQRNASIAILKKLKERNPDIVTFMGGFNCKENAGIAMLKEFSFLDYVFFGESDDIFSDVCRKMISGSEVNPEDLPYGVLKNGGPYPDEPPYRAIMDMDKVPMPDYDEYFELLNSPVGEGVYPKGVGFPKISIEASRGCWWGAKHQCTFCGLNNRITKFRRKSYDKVLDEMNELYEKYGIKNFDFVDNILPYDAFDYFIPTLIEENKGFRISGEIKANLSREQVKQLAEAGYYLFQVGVESLSDNELKLMSKGVSTIHNIACLKYGREYGIWMTWNILMGLPGETLGNINSQRKLLPLIEHLDICLRVLDIVYENDSVYCNNPEKYGIELEPEDYFKYCVTDNPDYLEGIAFQYKVTNQDQNWMMDLSKTMLRQDVINWGKRKKEDGSNIRLDFYRDGDSIVITDTRKCAVRENYRLSGIQKSVCLLTLEPIVSEKLTGVLEEEYSRSEIDRAIEELKDDRLLLEIKGKYLFLATETEETKAVRQ